MTQQNFQANLTNAVCLRLSKSTVEQADRLVGKLQADPIYEGMRISQSSVLRTAILRGLDELEKPTR